MIQKIKELRVQIDGLAQLVKGLKPLMANRDIPCHSYETREAYDKTILAKAWLGKCLQALDVPTPYKSDGNRHSKEDIEPTADTYKDSTIPGIPSFPIHITNHIERVDWLRQEIKNLENIGFDFDRRILTEETIRVCSNCIDLAAQYLIEARFWLGFELQRIKESME